MIYTALKVRRPVVQSGGGGSPWYPVYDFVADDEARDYEKPEGVLEKAARRSSSPPPNRKS